MGKNIADNNRRTRIPYQQAESLPTRFRKSTAEHGYTGFWGGVRFAVRFLANFYLNLLAMFVPYSGLRIFLHRLRGVKVGKKVVIGFNVTIDNVYPHLITIEDRVCVSGNNLIVAHSKTPEYYANVLESYVAPVVIKKSVWITVGVIVLPGVTIGEGTVVAANSVVTEDIPPNCIAAGNPAKVIKSLDAMKAKTQDMRAIDEVEEKQKL